MPSSTSGRTRFISSSNTWPYFPLAVAEQDVAGKARKARLRRLERIFVPTPIYFVTANAANRLPILAIPEIHSSFLEFARVGEDRGAFTGAYVLMPDHIHLFVALDPEMTLAAWMKSLKNSLSKTLRSLSIPAPHWQKGFFDHVLRSTDSYARSGNTFVTIQSARDW
jgi:REP-associated tyrosine transposase